MILVRTGVDMSQMWVTEVMILDGLNCGKIQERKGRDVRHECNLIKESGAFTRGYKALSLMISTTKHDNQLSVRLALLTVISRKLIFCFSSRLLASFSSDKITRMADRSAY